MKMGYHKPVLLHEAIEGLQINPSGTYVDVTYGGGGHSRAIFDQLNEAGRLYAFDQDPDAAANCILDQRFELIAANFSFMQQFLKFKGVVEVDGILADFGVSSHQFDRQERGFSTRYDGPLDMRMNPEQELDAAQIINRYTEKELSNLFQRYGELRNAKKIAATVVAHRTNNPFQTTHQLKELVAQLVPERFLNKLLAQVFQAIRIEVNQELDVIQKFLQQAANILLSKGRLVCISYHSLEDRLVKHFIREGQFEGVAAVDFYGNKNCPLRKIGNVIVPAAEEIKENNRARSAKMRIAEKI